MTIRRGLVAACAAFAVGAGGCGGSGGPPVKPSESFARWKAQADRICSDLSREIEAIGTGKYRGRVARDGTGLAAAIEPMIEPSEATSDAAFMLRRVRLPQERRADAERFVDALSARAATLRVMLNAAAREDLPAVRRLSEREGELARAFTEARDAAGVDCDPG